MSQNTKQLQYCYTKCFNFPAALLVYNLNLIGCDGLIFSLIRVKIQEILFIKLKLYLKTTKLTCFCNFLVKTTLVCLPTCVEPLHCFLQRLCEAISHFPATKKKTPLFVERLSTQPGDGYKSFSSEQRA